MGQPKKLIADVVRLSGRYPAGVLENREPIAQRFAPSVDLRQVARRAAEPPRVLQATTPTHPTTEVIYSAARFTPRTGWLIAGLVAAALAPGLMLGGMWLGSSGEMEPPMPQLTAPSAVLTASARIEAKAGDRVGFPITLDGTDGVPSRSVIAITGLPPASNFSEGRP